MQLSTSKLLLLFLPLLGREALGRPSVYSGNLGLEGIVHQSMSREERLLLEFRRHDDGVEGLAASSGHVLYRHVGRADGLFQFLAQRFRRDARRRRGLGRRCVCLGGHGWLCRVAAGEGGGYGSCGQEALGVDWGVGTARSEW